MLFVCLWEGNWIEYWIINKTIFLNNKIFVNKLRNKEKLSLE